MILSFKNITTVPDAKSIIDIVLSETQRRTPTQVHPQFKISRIRSFYMRKVKYCQQAFHHKLQNIIKQFPRIDDIHPFYSQLCDVLYDRDHYKLALGQVDTVRRVIDRIHKDYIRLLKYSDSPYKCKMLKRAGLGRMCTAVKKLQSPLVYLEEVRQHLSRLPSIDPNSRTLILTGFPNVGKSSFMNLLTKANVEVQPYAFTTRSLYVGHFDYAYIRWQLLDTPGLLDHPLVNRNTIELTAITALAYLQAAIIFIIDISEECGFSIQDQISLFHNIKALFEGKPLVVLLNKTDRVRFDELPLEKQEQLTSLESSVNSELMSTMSSSCLNATGVDEAKNKACEMLLQQRAAKNLETPFIGKEEFIAGIVDCSTKKREPHIPEVTMEDDSVSDQVLSKDLEEAHGGPGVYSVDLNAEWKLRNPDWTHDIAPEIFCGKNISDFIDPDIEQKLIELEQEEAALLREHEDRDAENALDEAEWTTTSNELNRLMRKIQLKRIENRLKKNRTRVAQLPRPTRPAILTEKHNKRIHGKLKSLQLPTKQKRKPLNNSNTMMDINNTRDLVRIKHASLTKKTLPLKNDQVLSAIQRHHQHAISQQKATRDAVIEHYKRDMGSGRNKGRAGDADRFIGTKMPRHLYNHKRSIGNATRR